MSMHVAFDADVDPSPVSAVHMQAIDAWAENLFSRQSYSLLSAIVPAVGLQGRRCEDVMLAVGVGLTSYYTKPDSQTVLTSIVRPGSVTSRSSETEFECHPLGISSTRPTWYGVLFEFVLCGLCLTIFSCSLILRVLCVVAARHTGSRDFHAPPLSLTPSPDHRATCVGDRH
jgi:hypothetical protein